MATKNHTIRSGSAASVALFKGMVLVESEPPEAQPTPPKAPEVKGGGQVVYLPAWPDAARACPNAVLRSALFGVLGRGERQFVDDERMASVEGVEIFYTGKLLDQSDLDVWEAVLCLCRRQAMGTKCSFSAYELLKLLGRTISGQSRKVLNAQIRRLHGALVRIQAGRYSYEGHLVHHVERDHDTHRYEVTLNPRLLPLFERDQYTLLDWNVRRALTGKPLAQWLHGFYSSHAMPYPLSIKKLRELCGSDAGQLYHFKEKLRKALTEVAKVLEEHGQTFSHALEGELVHVTRSPSSAQAKHIEKKPRQRLRKRPE